MWTFEGGRAASDHTMQASIRKGTNVISAFLIYTLSPFFPLVILFLASPCLSIACIPCNCNAPSFLVL